MMVIKKAFATLLFFSFISISCQETAITPEEKGKEQDRGINPYPTKIYVTFDVNGGMWEDRAEFIALAVKSDQSPHFPTEPSHEDYIFIGWGLECKAPFSVNTALPDFDKRLNADSKINAPITVYAIWAERPPNSRTVIFITSLENETPEKIHDVRYAYEYNGYKLGSVLPSTGIKKHYSGNGKWYLSHGGNQEFTPLTEVEPPELKVYAHWYPNVYVVSFLENSNSPPVYRSYPYEGRDILFPQADFPPSPNPPAPDPVEGSYSFLGWFFNEAVVVNPTGIVPANQNLSSGFIIEHNVTVYAGWRRSNNIITFQTYNGSDITPVYRAVTANGGSYRFTGDVPSVGNRENYISDEQWYLDENAGVPFDPQNIPNDFLAGQAKVYGNWLNEWMGKKIEFYHWNGGPKVAVRLARLNQSTGEGYSLMGGLPAVPPRSGHTSNGKWYYWRYDWAEQMGYEPFQNEFTPSTNIEHNMTVFAKWTATQQLPPEEPPPPPPPPVEETYKITFYNNKATILEIMNVPLHRQLNYIPEIEPDKGLRNARLMGWVCIPPADFENFIFTTFNNDSWLVMDREQFAQNGHLIVSSETIVRDTMSIYAVWNFEE
ncbi:MAG: InlB B-repeat-containing protein [Spirochaetaceae bacterium]|jgi:hypothetical protein|nr:InlB B-repeat-containing protein [Spirochaetaceae bacterium]